MSIATAITNLTNTIRGIASTKQDIKSAVNTDFEAINNEQIEQYPNLIRNAINQYKSYIPVVTGEGKQLSLNTVPLKPKEFALIGDTFQQQYEGKNLWGGFSNSYTTTAQGITFTVNTDGTVTASGTATGTAVSGTTANLYNTGIYKKLLAGTYTVSKAGTNYQLQVYSSDATSLAIVTTSQTKTTFTLTEETDVILRIRVNADTTINETVAFQLEEGSTATDFEPYVGGTPSPNPSFPQNIKVVTGSQTVKKTGKNLFDNTINAGSGDIYQTTIPTGKRITNTKSTTVTSTLFSGFAVMDLSNCVGKTIRAKTNFQASGDNNGRYTIGLCNSLGQNRTSKSTSNTSGEVISFVVPELSEGQTYLSLLLYGNATGTMNSGDYIDFTDIIITIDNEDMTYEPYNGVELPLDLGNIELCGIGEYQDILFKNTINSEYYNSELEENDWYKKKTIRKIICDGTETITKSTLSDVQNTQRFRLGSYNTQFIPSIGFSDKFIIKTADIRIGDFEFLQIGGTPTVFLYININLNRLTENTIDAFKTWLSNNNVTAYCVLESPQYEKITDETLISQLEAIEHTNMNNGTTIIYAENEEGLQPTLYMEAYKKIEE